MSVASLRPQKKLEIAEKSFSFAEINNVLKAD